MGFPKDFSRAQPEGNPQENPFLPELGCVVYHSMFKLEGHESSCSLKCSLILAAKAVPVAFSNQISEPG